MILLAKATVALLFTSLVNAQEEVLLPQFSLNAPYIDENLNNRFYNFGGDALVQVNEHVRLTQDKPSQRGWIWSRTVSYISLFSELFHYYIKITSFYSL